MKLANIRNKIVGEEYIIKATKDYILSFVTDRETEDLQTLFADCMTPVEVNRWQVKLDNGHAILISTTVSCINLHTGKTGTDSLGGTLTDSVDHHYSNAFSGYYTDLINNAMREAGVK